MLNLVLNITMHLEVKNNKIILLFILRNLETETSTIACPCPRTPLQPDTLAVSHKISTTKSRKQRIHMALKYLCTCHGKKQRITMSPVTSPEVELVLGFCRIIGTLILRRKVTKIRRYTRLDRIHIKIQTRLISIQRNRRKKTASQ